jgi:hypothetical protein
VEASFPLPLPLTQTMDDFFNPPADQSSDPMADFLAREKAALGSEFDTNPSSSSFDKDFERSVSAFPDLDGGDNDDGLNGFASAAPPVVSSMRGPYEGGMGAQVSVTGDNEFAAFENEYPEVEATPAPQVSSKALFSGWTDGPRGRRTDGGCLGLVLQHNGFAAAPSYQQPTGLFLGTPQPVEEESEFIRSVVFGSRRASWRVVVVHRLDRSRPPSPPFRSRGRSANPSHASF